MARSEQMAKRWHIVLRGNVGTYQGNPNGLYCPTRDPGYIEWPLRFDAITDIVSRIRSVARSDYIHENKHPELFQAIDELIVACREAEGIPT